jgi:hypothetical protein
MYIEGLLTALLILMAGIATESSWAVGLGTTTFISVLARLGGAPRWASWVLWVWLTAVIVSLAGLPQFLGGVPFGSTEDFSVAALWMLAGIWIAPVFIGPIAFLVSFRSWLSK